MLDYQLDPDEVNDKLADDYIEWLEANYSSPQIDDGVCPGFDEWLESLGGGDHDPEIEEEVG